MSGEVRLRYPLLWVGFGLLMAVGATLVSNPDPGLQLLGIVLLVLPLATMGAMTLAYYLLERFRSSG